MRGLSPLLAIAAMESRHQAKVNQWFRWQMASGRAQDVCELSLEDPIVRTLFCEWLLQRGFKEIRADQDLFDAIFFEVVRLSSSSDLREVAVLLYERGNYQEAEDVNWIAAHKERGDLPELLGRRRGSYARLTQTRTFKIRAKNSSFYKVQARVLNPSTQATFIW